MRRGRQAGDGEGRLLCATQNLLKLWRSRKAGLAGAAQTSSAAAIRLGTREEGAGMTRSTATRPRGFANEGPRWKHYE